MTKAELEARAAELGLTVTRYDGADGEPRVEDYERAIAEREAELVRPEELEDEGEERTYTVAGPFKVFGKRRGQTVTGKVVAAAVPGDELIEVDGKWANLTAHLKSGTLVATDS